MYILCTHYSRVACSAQLTSATQVATFLGAVGEVLLQFIQDQDHLSWCLPATDGIKELYCHSGTRNGCYGRRGEGVGGRGEGRKERAKEGRWERSYNES